MSWSEDRIHRWLLAQPAARGLFGSRGHDAAVLDKLRGRPVVCVDQTIEGVHFLADADPSAIGRKAAARAISDLAASAAHPRAIVMALAIPRGRSDAWIKNVLEGARATARKHGADLVGGDLSSTRQRAHVSVTALGDFIGRGKPPGRDRARRGDIVLLTGPVGGSSLGRHLAIRPRISAGLWLFARGARALMDVSDGLAWDLFRLARTAGVRIDLDLARVPVYADARTLSRASGRASLWHALHDGEDHELVATIAPRHLARVLREAKTRCRTLAVIGRVRAGSGLHLVDASGASRSWKKSEGGWTHGG